MKIRSGQDIKAARKRLRLQAKEFAPLICLTAESLSRIENGHRDVTPQTELLVRLIERDESVLSALMEYAQEESDAVDQPNVKRKKAGMK